MRLRVGKASTCSVEARVKVCVARVSVNSVKSKQRGECVCVQSSTCSMEGENGGQKQTGQGGTGATSLTVIRFQLSAVRSKQKGECVWAKPVFTARKEEVQGSGE